VARQGGEAVKLGDSKPRDDETKARLRAWELELEDEALRRFPEIHKLGTFGDPEFDEALEAAVDVIDGELGGGKSTAEIDLEMDLEEMELNGPDDAEDADEAASLGCHCPGRDGGEAEGR
jgi:hypothetical protein